ncbi:MAG TPA: DUF5666 domain-containing protein, partial [Candidatus Dormibacteraeota bacterium]|nr:DUF5666 domain-containing protein [Candidatus Dormibacteraeota bacterium]
GSGGPWTARGMMGGRGWLKGGGIGPFGAITITGIDGSQLSLRTTDGWTRTITVGSSTTITRGGQAIAIGDLKVGDEIRVRETRDSGGTFTITAIDVVLPHVEGTVGALTSDGFTVKAPDGSTTKVVVTSSTTYRTGRASGSKSDVKVGDRVAVRGTKAADGTITATTVQVAPAMAAGTVTAKTSTTITISLPGGTSTTIHVSSATTYKVAGKASATLADVAIGDRLVAQGTLEADGSLDATAVGSGPARGPGKGWGMGPGGPMGGFGPTSPGAPMGGFGPMGGMGGFGSGGDPGQQG